MAEKLDISFFEDFTRFIYSPRLRIAGAHKPTK
jgi:hypothetical protein